MSVDITCPECGKVRRYGPSDVKRLASTYCIVCFNRHRLHPSRVRGPVYRLVDRYGAKWPHGAGAALARKLGVHRSQVSAWKMRALGRRS